MAPVSSKTNFKTYDAQARLLRAIVAAHPEVRWNYKDIAKFFGESTADGIQFQFRSIKKDADSLKQTANSGGNPATALNLSGGGPSSALSTPRKATPSKPRASGGGRSTAKKANPIKLQPLSDADDDEDDDVDYNALEDTPSKSRVRDRVVDGRIAKNTSRRSNTPSRAATIAAAASISQAAAVDLTTSDSEVNTPDNTTGYEPAPADAKPAFLQQHQQPQHQQQAEQHLAQPMVQPAASFYAPSSFSQESSADIFFGNASDDLLHPSFVDSFADGYLDNDGIGEI